MVRESAGHKLNERRQFPDGFGYVHFTLLRLASLKLTLDKFHVNLYCDAQMEDSASPPPPPSPALNLAEQLVKLTSGSDRELALELRNRLLLPMDDVIAKIPGLTMSAKAAHAEVSRQTLYDWRNGENRPTPKQAKKLAVLTRISAQKIMGRKR
jgi:DNA-binding XRE family transcriptional regulator